jgi:hypothetical protein
MTVFPAEAHWPFGKILKRAADLERAPIRRSHRTRMVVAAAIATVTIVAPNTSALAAGRDRTPPTAPFLSYAQGYYCGVLIVGMERSTDNVTPQSQLKYEVFVDGAPFGPAIDQGSESGVWAWFQGAVVPPGPILPPGAHTVTSKAQDAAGNWSAPSRALPVTGYRC